MDDIAKRPVFWWVLFGFALTVVALSALLLIFDDGSGSLWFTIIGSSITMALCVQQLRAIRRRGHQAPES